MLAFSYEQLFLGKDKFCQKQEQSNGLLCKKYKVIFQTGLCLFANISAFEVLKNDNSSPKSRPLCLILFGDIEAECSLHFVDLVGYFLNPTVIRFCQTMAIRFKKKTS